MSRWLRPYRPIIGTARTGSTTPQPSAASVQLWPLGHCGGHSLIPICRAMPWLDAQA
jgi:hypothetical protein